MTQNLSAPLLSTSANPSLIDPAGPHESHKNIVRIDENGEVNIQKFHRHYFVRKGFVRHRDLLLLDPELPVPFPTAILTRDTSIILCVQPVRMLITENQCFIFNVPSLTTNTWDPQIATVSHPFVQKLSRALADTSDTLRDEAQGEESSLDDLSIVQLHEDAIQKSLESSDIPYEIRVLDHGLYAALQALDAEAFSLEHDTYPAVHRLANVNASQDFEKIHGCKVWLGKISAAAEELKEEIERVFKDDLDLYELYLQKKSHNTSSLPSLERSTPVKTSRRFLQLGSAKAPGKATAPQDDDGLGARTLLDSSDIEAAEDILDTSYMKINGVIRRLRVLREYVSSREIVARIALDKRRNEFIVLDANVNNLALGFGFTGAVASIFGMNLWNTVWQDSREIFYWVVFVTLLGTVALPVFARMYMRSRHLLYVPDGLPV